MYLPRPLISHLYTDLVRSHHPLSAPVLLLVALEPDSLCACRILTSLLKRDYIPHKIQPVSGYADLSKAGEELVRPMKTTQGGSGGVVICLGVGALVDLGAVLGLEDEDTTETMCGVEVWVLDARRPYNLDNVFGGLPTDAPTDEIDAHARSRTRGVEKGCLQKSYRSGRGGIIVFDDGDIVAELNAERTAYCALSEMPEIEEEDGDEEGDEDQEELTQDGTSSRKRKSSSDRDPEDDDGDEDDDEPPRQRRRSNSGSSLASTPRSTSPPSSQPTSPASKVSSPKPQTAKQLRRRLWKLRQGHESVLAQYNSLGTSYSEPVSTLAYSLATDLGREDNDILWLAIIGATSLELSGHTSTGLGTSVSKSAGQPSGHHRSWRMSRSAQTYTLLRDEVKRLNPPPADRSPTISPSGSGGTSSPSDTSIRLSPDPRFLLLRHWSLYDSMLHSPYLAARLHVWNESGVKRLHKLLAKMGVSLSQCKQTYTHMDMELKKILRERLLKYAGVYGLDDMVPSGMGRASYEQEGWSFIRSWGWKAQLSAVDVGVILGAILDVGTSNVAITSTPSSTYTGSSQSTNAVEGVADRSETLIPRFFAAYDALAPNHPTHLITSIPAAQHLLRSILRTGSSLLVKHQVRHLRAFRMGVVKEGPDLALFANSPGALVKLALWVGEAIAVSERDKTGSEPPTPLVLAALDEARGTYVVVGTGGGIGGGEDLEARKEKAELRKKREEEKEQKRKIREEKKAARRAQKELLGEDSDAEDDEDQDSSESESEGDSESEDDDEAEQESKRKRGYGHNRFGIAFQQVVEETNARVRIDSFDHCIVEVKKEDLGGFLEGLSLKAVVGK